LYDEIHQQPYLSYHKIKEK
jgi:hypothetical protein